MRYILIDAMNRRVWDCATPFQIDEWFIARELRCDVPERIELTDCLDLWIPSEPRTRGFRIFSDGPDYAGSGMLCGRTRLEDIKGLSHFFNIEMVTKWIVWPPHQSAEMRRPTKQRPTWFSQIGPSLDPYHRIAPGGAKESPYLMQLYA